MSDKPKPSKSRLAGLVLALMSVAVLAVTIPSMAKRLDRRANTTRWATESTIEESFDYFQGTKGSITFSDEFAHLQWGDNSVQIPITGEPYPGMSGLRGHSQWIALLAMASVVQGDLDELEEGIADGSIHPKLIVVTRETPTEEGPEGWADASTKAWRYRFWELTPTGEILPYTDTHTHTYYGKEIVESGFLSYRAITYMPNTWQFAAAMHVTPSLHTPAARSASPLSYPNFINVRQAIDAMGWTWPVAGASIFFLILGGLMFASSFVGRPKQKQTAHA